MAEMIDNRYRLVEKIGEGGMGAVYRAHDERLGRDVAIKRLRVMGVSDEVLQQFHARFQREAQTMARFQHPNIVTILDFGHDDGGVYLVMEFLPNGSLKDRMHGAMVPEKVGQLMAPIADALQYLHQRGMIHRDVKPANILFDENDNPMLADFGVIKLMEGNDATLTSTGAAVGTPAYMAPELIGGEASPKVDQYALGIVYYELLTGKKPFQGRTPVETLTMHKYQPLPDPRSYNATLPESLSAFLRKALSKEPANRFVDTKQMVKAYQSALSGIHAMQEAPTEIVAQPPVQRPSVNTPSTKPVRSSYPNRESSPPVQSGKKIPGWVWGIAGALVVILIIAIVNGRKKEPVPEPIADMVEPVSATNTLVEDAVVDPTATEKSAEEEQAELPTETLASEPPTATPSFTSTPTIHPTVTAEPTITNTPEPVAGDDALRTKDGMTVHYVPAGAFTMGSQESDIGGFLSQSWCETCEYGWYTDEQPQRSVKLDAFWIDETEVTNLMYARCVNAGSCSAPAKDKSYSRDVYYGSSLFADYPVIYVTWAQAKQYCQWVGGYLPTEAEWEKAARGTDARIFPWGNSSPSCKTGNYKSNENYCVADTNQVASYAKNVSPYGAYDMAGNVWEWTADWYQADWYQYADNTNPSGPSSGDGRVVRGGSWDYSSGIALTVFRDLETPDYASFSIGFRCAMETTP